MSFWIFIRNLLWAIPLEEQEKRDYYGELFIFFLIYPYRFFIAVSILTSFVFGIQCAYLLFLVWILALISYGLDCIYERSPKLQAYAEKEFQRQIRQNEIKREKEYKRIIELHKDDPPKRVTKAF